MTISIETTATTDTQPVVASAARAVRQLAELGDPLSADVMARVAAWEESASADIAELADLLAPYVLLDAVIEENGAALTTQGKVAPVLVQHGWRTFLVAVRNPHGIRASLNGGSAGVLGATSRESAAKPGMWDHVSETAAAQIRPLWLQADLKGTTALSGVPLEYAVISLYARDSGAQTATFALYAAEEKVTSSITRSAFERALFVTLQEQADYSARIEFEVEPSRDIAIEVREPDGRSTVASVTVTDAQGRAYPSKAMRLAPDMVFQEHVYRATGEPIRLPDGTYSVRAVRGPEYRPVDGEIEISDATTSIPVVLDRWVNPASHGYYSSDPHIHGAGCSHYSRPTEGVTPETMIRHVRGEGLNLGSVLTWGPCYYHQKQYFSGDTISPAATLEYPEMQAANGVTWEPQETDVDSESMLRYDIEVSGFPSSHSGHAVLLGLTDQDYPGTSWLEDWPSWNLPIHRWAHAQGAMTGYAHCALFAGTEELPNYVIPSFAGGGSNEIIVDVPLGFAEFQAGAEFSPAAELNVWYHLLNVGYRTLMVGETDYPCAYDEGPGVGRTYVRLPEIPSGPRALEAWLSGLREDASYFGDGRSHVFDLRVDGDGSREQTREMPGSVRVTATVAAWLPEELPAPLTLGGSRYSAPMGWHLERSRIGDSRRVVVELVVNGYPVAEQEILADGTEREIVFETDLASSSWVAVRILRSVHAQPVFVEVAGRPIRASKRSAQWLADCVERLWTEKNGFIRESEKAEARAAYDAAIAIYRERKEECDAE
jgi:hypothetical protein